MNFNNLLLIPLTGCILAPGLAISRGEKAGGHLEKQMCFNNFLFPTSCSKSPCSQSRPTPLSIVSVTLRT
jgi:hypothetical protein